MAPGAGLRQRSVHPSNAVAERLAAPSRYSEGRPGTVIRSVIRPFRRYTPFSDLPALRRSVAVRLRVEIVRVRDLRKMVSIRTSAIQSWAVRRDGPVLHGIS